MGKKPSVVHVNGNSYDATTGQIIGKRREPVIDGLIKNPRTTPIINQTHLKPNAIRPKQPEYPAKTVHSNAQRTKTLMRRLVTVPSLPKRPVTKLSPNPRTKAVNPARMAKAMSVNKHKTVSRFGSPSASTTNSRYNQSSISSNHSIRRDFHPSASSGGTAAAAIKSAPNVIANISNSNLERMLDEALIRADAHKKALGGRYKHGDRFWNKAMRMPAWLLFGSPLFIIVVTVSFFAWRNVPQLSTKVASMRAHISASIPSYSPTGFSMAGPAVAGDNSVTFQYKDNNDASKFYTIKEEQSNLDTSSLIASHNSSSQQVQTSQANGVQIVILGSKSMCVSGGKLTTIANKAGLPPDELLNVAKSVCS